MEDDKKKSLFVAYLCWLFGGIFGLHHLYLGRDFHAFITLTTFGGYFTLGLIRDLWRLPEYVKDANNDLEYIEWLYSQIKIYPRPPSSIVRQSGLMIMGNLFAYLVEYAIPKELLNDTQVAIIKFSLIPFASALGVWLAGNVGRHKGSFGKPLLASYIATTPSFFFDIPLWSFSTFAATIVFNRYCKEWRVEKVRKKSFLKRASIFIGCALIYLLLWSSWLYFECTVDDPEIHEPIKCRIAFKNFINSPAYTNISEAIFILIEHVRHQGVMGLWKEMMQEFDVSGKASAFATLGLKENATPEEILVQYKKLSREYHPDREKDESKKSEKHERFIQIQEAYRKLQHHTQRYKIQEEQEQVKVPGTTRDEL